MSVAVYSGQSGHLFDGRRARTGLAQPFYDPLRGLHDAAGLDRVLLSSLKQAVNQLSNLGENWDGFGSAKPKLASIRYATICAELLFLEASATGLPWSQPHVSASEEGDVVFEWWSGAHKLTVYANEAGADFIQVWGPDIVEDMKDGPIENGTFEGLWRWLHA